MNWRLLSPFAAACEALEVEPPAILPRALAMFALAEEHRSDPSGPLLTLTDDELRERITAIAIRDHDNDGRGSTRGMQPGIDAVTDQLAREVREAILPELDRVVSDLQERFAELAAPLVHAATVYGFTADTTSDYVIRLADEGAANAWRAVPAAWQRIQPIVNFRVSLSRLFDVSPTADEIGGPGIAMNYTVCFAAADNWSDDRGYFIDQSAGEAQLDWLALAAGGLRLNTPTEVRQKLEDRARANPLRPAELG